MSFLSELKRRSVFRVGAAYLVAGWLLVQVVETVFPAFGIGDIAIRIVVIALAIGFVPALILAWAFELTPEGLRKDVDVDREGAIPLQKGRRLDLAVIFLLVLALGFFAVDKFVLAPDRDAARLAEARSAGRQSTAEGSADNGKVASGKRSVAVLPFVAFSQGRDDGYFADGLTEEILNSLASVPELLVTARTSSFYFKGTDRPVPEIAAALGVDNIVEGSVRRAGDRVRITAQLIRAADGFHLWSRSYDRTLEDIFAVQEDIASSITEVLDVVLDEDARARMRSAGIQDVDAFIAYQKGVDAFVEAHKDFANLDEGLAVADGYFDQVLEQVPDLTTVRLMKADYRSHIVFALAAGIREEAFPGEAIQALEGLREEYDLAWRSAAPGDERQVVEVERSLIGDDWSTLAADLDEAMAPADCPWDNWTYLVAEPYGWVEPVIARYRQRLRCDPLDTLTTFNLASAQVWAGDPIAALRTIEDAETRGIRFPWLDDLRFKALLASGQYRDDPAAFAPAPKGTFFEYPRSLLREALGGDPDTARRVADDFLSSPASSDWSKVVVAAIVGDREVANQTAALIDGRPGGTLVLSQALHDCQCGAPWDLEATPNFGARIREAGFDWPPPKPIDYPLKTW